MSPLDSRVTRLSLGKHVGYIVNISPGIRFDKLLYNLRIFVQKLGMVRASYEELNDWIWFGKAVNVSVVRRQVDDRVELLAESISLNEDIRPIEPEMISILSFDKDEGILSLERGAGRRVFLRVSEQHLKEAIEGIEGRECYGLFIDREGETRLVYVIDAKEYSILARAKEIARTVVEDLHMTGFEGY